MIKINISFSKKIPGAEQFSSLSFHGSMERELSDGLTGQQIQEEFQRSYALLEQTVETEIVRYTAQQPAPKALPVQSCPQRTRTSGARGRGTRQTATASQLSFINRLTSSRGLTQQQVDLEVMNIFGIETVRQLSKKQASEYIDTLNDRRAA